MKREMPVVLAAVVLLSACGGDGGGTGTTDNSTAMGSGSSAAPPLQSAPAPAQPFNVPPTTLGTTVSGMGFTLTYSNIPNSGVTTFNGQSANSSAITVTVQQGGTTLTTDSSTDYYLLNPFTPLGITGTASGTAYTLDLNSVNPLPATLTVGASGTLFTGNYLATGTSTVIGMTTQTFSVTAGTASAITLTIKDDGTINGQAVTDSTVFAVDSMGNLTLQSVEAMVNGQDFTFAPPTS